MPDDDPPPRPVFDLKLASSEDLIKELTEFWVNTNLRVNDPC